MRSFQDCISDTKYLFDNGKSRNGCSKIYYSSNEDLQEIFSFLDFKGKRVLSVVGSGDQAIAFYNCDVKSLDLFDINPLTIYYYYLRIWHMMYYGELYIDQKNFFDIIKRVLKYVNPSNNDELNAYNYWMSFIELFDGKDLDKIFYNSFYNLGSCSLNYGNILKNFHLNNCNFYNFDLSSDISLNKKYDVVYTSNIVDYIKADMLAKYRDNIYGLLNNGGFLVCSNVGAFDYNENEKEIFEKKFTRCDIPSSNSYWFSPGKIYIKK